jgi:hypothetical protein
MPTKSLLDPALCPAAYRLAWRGCNTSRSVESTRRGSGSLTNSGKTVRHKGC